MAFVSALVAAIGLTGFTATVATFAIRTVLSIGVSKLIGNRLGSKAAGAEPSGSRVQLPPATDNKLPVVYGSAFIGPIITDAKISSDQKTMWYVCTFAEHTDTTAGSGYTFDQIYYDGKLVTFGAGDYGGNNKVVSLTTNTQGGGSVDTKINGNLWIYLFPNGVAGSQAGGNTGSTDAVTIMSDSNIPVGQRWNGTIYTSGGQSVQMANTAFAIIKVVYNTDAGTTQLGAVSAKITNTLTKPGSVIKDYLLNSRYGCGIPLDNIDTASLTALDTYSDLPVYYTPAGGGPLTSQARYRINGPLDTGQDCLTNLQLLVDACDSWLQYSELTGKWKVVINQSYTEAGETLSSLYSVDDDNLVGGVDVSPIDLNASYNQLEVQYPNTNIKDQTDFIFIDLFTEYPSLISENEPLNKLTLQSQIINNYVQAKFIGIRRLLQAREDLIISFATDYSGIQVEAGDVIKVTLSQYGWTNKLFRVSNVVEEKYQDGSLGARLTAFEYNDSIYDDDLDITDFVPADNTGLTDPNIIGTPNAPTVNLLVANTIAQMSITGNVPYTGLVTNLDFNVGTDSNSANHTFYTTVNNANGEPLVGNTLYTITSGDLSSNTYYWSVTARNRFVGVRSNASNAISWTGTNVTNYTSWTACNANSSGTTITSDAISNLRVGANITKTSGTGTLVANSYVTSVISNTQFVINTAPTVALSNACIALTAGGISGNNVQANTITGNNIQSNTITLNNISNTLSASEAVASYSFSVAAGNTLTTPVNVDTRGNVSTGNWAMPLYINDVYSGGGGDYPFFEGTSSTADYYVANSTGRLTPATADLLYLQNGDLNWWVNAYKLCGAGSNISNAFVANVFYNTQLVSDANTIVQMMPFVSLSTNPANLFIADTETMYTYYPVANQPLRVEFRVNYSSAADITGAGVVMRIGSAANVYMTNGAFSIRKEKK